MPDYRLAARRAARKYGIDPEIFERQIGAESGFNPNAGSPAGAQGIAQIMPGTAKAWGVDLHDGRVTDDLEAAAKNMARYIEQFGGWENALRAYNAGPGAVQKSRGYGETNAYVRKILQGQNPKPTTGGGGDAGGSGDTIVSRQVSSLDEKGFDEAVKEAALGRFLEKRRGPENLLTSLGAVRTDMPSPDEFMSVKTVTERIPGERSSGSGGGGSSKGGLRPHGGYQGTKGPADQLRRIGEQLGLQVTSSKRHNANPHSGSRSDHDHGNKDAFAYDLSNGSSPTKEMDQTAFRIARRLGIKDYKFGTPINRVVTRNGIRYQLIYRGTGAAFGGNHMNHVHIGLKRVGKRNDKGVLRK